MTTSAIRIAVPAALAVLLSVTPALAKDPPDCAAALKAAQADKTDGKLAKALTELATCSQPACPKATQKRCADLTQAITASQPTVVFSAKDASGAAVTAVTVTVDGTVVATKLDGVAVPVDPGSHTVKFEMDGATPVEKQLSVDPGLKGQAVAVDLDANPPAPPPAPAVAVQGAGDAPGSMTDVTEDPTKRYYFIGLRYRGDVIPKFMINMFVDGGATVYSNSVGIEADLRHDGFSLIPALTYTSYSTGDMLFLQKGKDPTNAGYWSLVNSGLSGIYASADLLWSVHVASHWDFEYGAEFGLGILFGSLENNWVYAKNGGQISSSNYAACTTATAAEFGCRVGDHSGATAPGHINDYQEPSWVNGGSKPNIFPLINFPQVGFRYKPIKQMEARFGLGFSLTGFWFGVSANYGLENPTK
jgi:hypothetical protein